mgnify:CR=1 FL=1
MAEKRAPRKPRAVETRKDETRDQPWEPASILLILFRKRDGSSVGYELL